MINIKYYFTIVTPHDTKSAHNATRQLAAKRSCVTKVIHYELTDSLKTENTPLRVGVLEQKKITKIFMPYIKFSLP